MSAPTAATLIIWVRSPEGILKIEYISSIELIIPEALLMIPDLGLMI
jgi:hypothetical protein